VYIITLESSLSFIECVRDRPFNLKGVGGYGFLFRSEFFFRTTQELEYYYFLSRKACIFFPHSKPLIWLLANNALASEWTYLTGYG
jgi:hypothetical protein